MKPQKSNQFGPEWQKGLALFFELSGWLVGPLIIALFLGKWLDQKYQTDPWWFLTTTGIAFGFTIIGLVLETKKYLKSLEKELKDQNSNNPKLDHHENPRIH
jgi:F0F1-type ATP synthase assembly protein I